MVWVPRNRPFSRPPSPTASSGIAAAASTLSRGPTLQGNLGYVAPLAAFAYATIAVAPPAGASEYSRVQLFGSGALVMVWMAGVRPASARVILRVTTRLLPTSLSKSMPELPTCRWLDFDAVRAGAVRVDGIVADLSVDLGESQLSALANAAIAGVPVLDRRYILEILTGRTPLGGLTPNEFGFLAAVAPVSPRASRDRTYAHHSGPAVAAAEFSP